MSPEKQRVAIAEACGWKCAGHPDQIAATGDWEFAYQFVLNPTGELVTHNSIPDYLADLNACHAMEKVLNDAQWPKYFGELRTVILGEIRLVSQWCKADLHATADEKCEAFLRTLGLWEEEQ